MNVKECLFRMHHGVFISDDDDEMLQEFRELTGAKFKMRPDDKYTADMQEYKTFERMIDRDLYLGIQQPNAAGLRGPQGHRNMWDGCQFDSIWEYAFYRYHKELAGNNITRNVTEWIPYFDENGKSRRFYYDFLLNGIPHEVKGIFRPTDIAKMQATAGQVTFISKVEIKPIMKELDINLPGWRNDCIFN